MLCTEWRHYLMNLFIYICSSSSNQVGLTEICNLFYNRDQPKTNSQSYHLHMKTTTNLPLKYLHELYYYLIKIF